MSSSSSLCPYKDMFGKVGTGLHSYRIFNIAVVDVLLTVLLAYMIKVFIPKHSFLAILVWVFILGIVLHRVFCVRTTVDKALFG